MSFFSLFLGVERGGDNTPPQDALRSKIKAIVTDPDRAGRVFLEFKASLGAIEDRQTAHDVLQSQLRADVMDYTTDVESMEAILKEMQTLEESLVRKLMEKVVSIRAQVTENEWNELVKMKLRGS